MRTYLFSASSNLRPLRPFTVILAALVIVGIVSFPLSCKPSGDEDSKYIEDVIADVRMVPGTHFFDSETRLQITTEKGYHWTTPAMRYPIKPGMRCRVHLGYIYRIDVACPNGPDQE